MTQLEDQLREILHRDAAALDVVEAGPEHAKRRARQRNKHRRAAIASLGVAGIVGGTVAALEARPNQHAQISVGSEPAAPPAPLKLSWRSVTGTVQYTSEHFTGADGVTYALSTAPGAQPNDQQPPQAVYKTRDGEHFTSTTLSIGVGDLVSDDGVLYALTSAPGDGGAAAPFQLGSSTNGGGTWENVAIPLQFEPNAQTSVRIARRDHTTVVVASSSVYEHESVAATATDEQTFVRATADGTTTPIEKQMPKLQSHEQKVLIRTDGGDWKTSSLDVGQNVIVRDVTATSHGFLLLTSPITDNPNPGAVLYESVDGHSWQQVGPPLADTAYEVKISGDRVLGIDTATLTAYVSSDAGHSFTTTNLRPLVPEVADDKQTFPVIDVGPLGVAVLVNASNRDPEPSSLLSTLLFSADGVQWSAKTLATPGVDKLWPWDVRVGTDHVDVSYNETGYPTGTVAPARTFIGTPERS